MRDDLLRHVAFKSGTSNVDLTTLYPGGKVKLKVKSKRHGKVKFLVHLFHLSKGGYFSPHSIY